MKKYLIYSLLALLSTVLTFSSCSKDDDEETSNSVSKRVVTVSLYSTTTGAMVGTSTTTATSVNGKNTLSCVEKDLDGNILNEYTVENASDLAVNLIGTWRSTSYTYTDDYDASENESGTADGQNYAEILFTAKKVIQRLYEDGSLSATVEFAYTLEGNSIKMNGTTISVTVDGDVLTTTEKFDEGTQVQKYSRK